MLAITEVTAPPSGRPRSFRSTGIPNVRATGFGTYYGEIRVGHRQRAYTGTFRSLADAAAAVAAIRRWRDRERAELPAPVVARRAPAPAAEPAAYAFFGR